MEDALQHQLDLQWDALEARSPEIQRIRREFLKLLSDLEETKAPELANIEVQLQLKRDVVAKADFASHRIEAIKPEITAIEQGDLGKKREDLRRDLYDIDNKIASLQQERELVLLDFEDVNSTIESQTARLRRELLALSRVDAQHAEAARKQVATLKIRKKELETELLAIDSGKQLWSQVTSTLDELDTRLRNIGPQTSGILEEALHTMEGYLEVAQENNWNPLVIAISHELEIVKAALQGIASLAV